MAGHLYFHSPCFDGIASAALALDFLEARRNWLQVKLEAVNYGARDDWLSRSLPQPSAVVDFLYHPDAMFWADHHPTTFLTTDWERDFQCRSGGAAQADITLYYEVDAPSCARLLWQRLSEDFGYRDGRYRELVGWADKIDAARYDSVQEALFSRHPAVRIDRSLALASGEDCIELVSAIRRESLEMVASLPAVERRYARARELMEAGLERFRAGSELTSDGIVIFDVESDEDVLIPRYAPYFFYPDARYSAGVIRGRSRDRITAMRNPWRDFESVPLGRIFEELGGGGHARIGSVVLGEESSENVRELLNRIVARIRRAGEAVAQG